MWRGYITTASSRQAIAMVDEHRARQLYRRQQRTPQDAMQELDYHRKEKEAWSPPRYDAQRTPRAREPAKQTHSLHREGFETRREPRLSTSPRRTSRS